MAHFEEKHVCIKFCFKLGKTVMQAIKMLKKKKKKQHHFLFFFNLVHHLKFFTKLDVLKASSTSVFM
jgi:hypothetical protein